MSRVAETDWLSAIWIVLLMTAGVLPALILMIRLAQLNVLIGIVTSLFVLGGVRAGWEIRGHHYWPLRPWEKRLRVYRALGVPLFGLFVIRGRYLKRVARQTGARPPVVTRGTLPAVLEAAETGERIHVAALIASLPLMAVAWLVGWAHWTAFLAVSNVLLNVYPIMLQRYLRARIERM